MTGCERCQNLPAPFPEHGTLYIAPPLSHTKGTIRNLLRDNSLPFEEPATEVLAIAMVPGRLQVLGVALATALSPAELRDARSLLVAQGEELTLADLARMQPLGALVAKVRGGWLLEMLAEGRLLSHFQPIVRSDDPAEVFAFECLLRGRGGDGTLISPGLIYEVARDADLIFHLDRAARLTAVRSAIANGLDLTGAHLFINFNPTSIYDPAFCLRSTIAAIRDSRLRPDHVVFEVVESDKVGDIDHLARIVDTYRAAGFRVALDDLGSGYGSLNLLSGLRPDFVKLDMGLIRGVDLDPYKAGVVRKLLEMARELGIRTVAEGIETAGECEWLRECGADYMQGYFIARPGPRPVAPGGSLPPHLDCPDAEPRSRVPGDPRSAILADLRNPPGQTLLGEDSRVSRSSSGR